MHRFKSVQFMSAEEKKLVFRNWRGNGNGEEAYEFFADDTLRADDQAFFLKVRDVVTAGLSEVGAEKIKNLLQAAARDEIVKPINDVIEVVTKRFELRDSESGGILRNLIEDSGRAGLTRWGLANAITRLGNTEPDYNRATELEAIGGQVITLDAGEWKEIAA